MNIHRNTKNFYEALVIVPKFIPANDSTVILEQNVQKHIIYLETKVADSYIQDIQDCGFAHICKHAAPCVDSHFDIYDTNSERFLDEDGEPNPSISESGSELQSINCEMHGIMCIQLRLKT